MKNEVKSAIDVARYLINKCNDLDISISNLKLQKLLYFSQGFSLALTDQPLFEEEIEPWDFGPVVPVVYREYKMFGANDIPKIETYFNKDFDSDDFLREISFDKNIFSNVQKAIMDTIVEQFGRYSANSLVTITHRQSPWINSYKKRKIISKESIGDYFRELLKGSR
ncbi:MAG: Panacea domain-containing protein [Thomasclavelia sp.]